jgi:parallel beta-helix repeat protein
LNAKNILNLKARIYSKRATAAGIHYIRKGPAAPAVACNQGGDGMKKITQNLPNLLFLISFFGLLFIAANALAVDGVIEISQAGAEAGGITPSDDPGFPVTVSEEGSYVLTSNLEVPADSNGIDISANRVTLDLNGFAIIGNGGDTGDGVNSFQPTVEAGSNVVVRNGAVKGMGGIGVEVGPQSRVEAIRALGNGSEGINATRCCVITRNTVTSNHTGIRAAASIITSNILSYNDASGIYATGEGTITDNKVIASGGNGVHASSRCTITGNTVSDSGEDGVYASDGCTITGNTVTGSGVTGVHASDGCTITGNTLRGNAKLGEGHVFSPALGTGDGCKIIGNAVSDNGWIGIWTGTACTVSDNNVFKNGNHGINAGSGSTITGNAAYENGNPDANTGIGIHTDAGCTVRGNTANNNGNHGIGAGPGSTVVDNTVHGNGGYGLALTGNVGYKGNVITGNANTVSSTGISMGDNVCGSDCTCP